MTALDEDAAPEAPAEAPRRVEPMRWRMPWVRTVVLIAVVGFACGVVGWLIGRPSDPSFSSVDVGFLADMTEHHSGALTLGFAYLPRGEDATFTSMARDIITDQSQEIGTMNGLLAEADDTSTVGDGTAMDWMGHPVPSRLMPGLATRADLDRLATESGRVADDDFSTLMIYHHDAGAEMAEYAAEFGSNDTVRALARKMAKTQRFEIAEMNRHRQALDMAVVDPPEQITNH
ncbi:MAG TPA: DUF305 domain-containing protein [Acidimicrobiia bacterium]